AVSQEIFESFRKDFLQIFTEILGLKVEVGEDSQTNDTLDGLMEVLIELRNSARKEKNWAVSDQIRDKLKEVSIKLEDTAKGTDWYFDN
ncbi:MAG: cysteine--tRNA ligase, partial [Bacteroidota bacterium]